MWRFQIYRNRTIILNKDLHVRPKLTTYMKKAINVLTTIKSAVLQYKLSTSLMLWEFAFFTFHSLWLVL